MPRKSEQRIVEALNIQFRLIEHLWEMLKSCPLKIVFLHIIEKNRKHSGLPKSNILPATFSKMQNSSTPYLDRNLFRDI